MGKTTIISHTFCCAAATIILLLLAGNTVAQNRSKVYAITHVNIIPMTRDNAIIKNATVVIAGNKILSINKAVPKDAQVINGRGKWLIPGLIDMHVHSLADIDFGEPYPTKGANVFCNTQDVMLPYVAAGVTTIFDLNSRVEHFAQRNEIKKGLAVGPRMALAACINGGNGDGKIANTPSDGRQTVRIAKAEGYDFIKVYSNLDVKTYKAIVDEAGKQHMKVVGHIPNAFKGRLTEAFVPHFDMVAHAEEFAKHAIAYDREEAERFAAMAAANGTWLTPTLTVIDRAADQARSLDSIRRLSTLKYVPPLMQSKWLTANIHNSGATAERIAHLEKINAFNKLLVKTFSEAGIPIVAGTDAGCSGVVWGFSLHDELALLAEAGMTNEQVLTSATRLPAEWLGLADKTGTVKEGMLADLVLLDANPLSDIHNTTRIFGVFFDGRWVARSQISTMLANLARRYAADLDKYEWKRRKEY